MSIIINLFGTSIRCWVCEIPIGKYNELEAVAKKNNITIDNVIFDLELLNQLGYNHWSEVYSTHEIQGFLIDKSNRIEIKKGRRMLSKFTSQDILCEDMLFNLYNTNVVDFKVKQKLKYKYMIIGQEEIGSHKYRIGIDKFHIDKLCISIYNRIVRDSLMFTFSYDGIEIPLFSEDTLVSSFFVELYKT